MKTKDLIEWLNMIVLGNDIPRETKIREGIIKKLKELDDARQFYPDGYKVWKRSVEKRLLRLFQNNKW